MEPEVDLTLTCFLEFRPSARARTDSANADAQNSAEVQQTTGEAGETSASQKDDQKRGMCISIYKHKYDIHL